MFTLTSVCCSGSQSRQRLPFILSAKLQESDIYTSVLKMSVCNGDFKLGKTRGLTWHLLRSLTAFISTRTDFPSPSLSTADHAFRRFTRQPSAAILTMASKVFRLRRFPGRYDDQVEALAREGAMKEACDAAVSLGRVHFPLETFSLPLLLMDKPTSMETYVKLSKDLKKALLECLDKISSGELLVADLVEFYPSIKVMAAHKLSGKPLDKMIKKYAVMWGVSDTHFPRSKERWAKVDLDYWIRQMFSSSSSNFDLQLENWRELVNQKVGDNKQLQHYLVSEVFTYSREEGKRLASSFGINGFEDSSESEEEEEDWDAEVEERSGLASAEQPTAVERPEDWDDIEEVKEVYLELPSSAEVTVVDTKEKFSSFMSDLKSFCSHSDHHLGLDVEFIQNKMNLIQISLGAKIFLLDWDSLETQLEKKDLTVLKETIFKKKSLVVGFGLTGDLKLLSKSVPGWEDLVTSDQKVVDLEKTRTTLCHMVGVTMSSVRGLSGLCVSVLGRRLNKSEQISDWSRRPLRPAQIKYAALDAFSCWKIFEVIKLQAKEMDQGKKFDEFIFKEVEGAKAKKKESLTREMARAKLESSVAGLADPLFKAVKRPVDVRLVCDNMLQGLARRLRTFGVDCLALDNGQDHLDCVTFASAGEERFVVSKGSAAASISRRLPKGHTLSLKSNEVDLQVEEVFKYFNIIVDSHLQPRCSACNGGQIYQLSQDLVRSVCENVKMRRQNKPILTLDFGDSDSDEDWQGETEQLQEVQESHRRLEVVRVVSSFTGEVRRGEVNTLTGHLDTGAQLQLDHLETKMAESVQEVSACGDCGKLYFK